MVEFRQIKLSVFLVLILRFSATRLQSVFVREGGKVTLTCKAVVDQVECGRTTWSFSRYTRSAAEDLVKCGKIVKHLALGAKIDKMTSKANCSLTIRRATAENAGRYFCLQDKQNQNQVDLSVVQISEHKNAEQVTLTCSVLTYGHAQLNVNWFLNNQKIDQDNKELVTHKSYRSANVTFLTTHFVVRQLNYKSLKCKVGGAERQFAFRSQISGKEHETSDNSESTPESSASSGFWWLYVIVAVGVAAIAAVVLLVRWRKTKGKKNTQMDENMEDTEVNISYASIGHSGEPNHQVRSAHAAVTYSCVKVGPSTDPSNIYATIN